MIILYLELLILSVLIIASLWFWWQHIKTERQKHKLNTAHKIPFILLMIGAFIGSTLAYILGQIPLNMGWLGAFIGSLITGIIPIFIAYTRDVKDVKLIYAFSFAAMCLPLWLLWFLIALILALSGKKISTKKGVKKHEK